jgi:hypothetical protein
MERNVFGHSHNQRNFCFKSLLDCSHSLVSGYIDGSGVRLELLCCLCVLMLVLGRVGRHMSGRADRADRGEHGKAQMLPSTARRHAANNIGAPGDGVSGIRGRLELSVSSRLESAGRSCWIPHLLSGEALEDHASVTPDSKMRERVRVGLKTGCRAQEPTMRARGWAQHPVPDSILRLAEDSMHSGRLWHSSCWVGGCRRGEFECG